MPASTFNRVDLPVPLPPTRPVRSSGVMSQLASSKRSFGPKRLPAEESWSICFYFRISSGLEEDQGACCCIKSRHMMKATRGEGVGKVSVEDELDETAQVPGRKRRKPIFPLWLSRLGAVVLMLLVVLLAVGEYVAHNAEPMLRRRVIANLEERFHSPVELDALHLSLLHGLQVSGSGLRILYLAGPERPDAHPENAQPMISVNSFQFRSGVRELFEPTMRVVTVYVQGMTLNIPPKQEGRPLIQKDDPKRKGQPRIGLVVDKIICSDVTLSIETNKPGKSPLVFDIRNVTLRDVGAKKPLVFVASLVNPKPVGNILSTGHFGPWQGDNPRDTPIDGTYEFRGADLDTIKGLGGILSSTGSFSGALGQIGVSGSTETPDFSLDVSEHKVALHTDYQAIVDGTTGDTTLTSVRATFLNTVLLAKGSILRSGDKPGGALGGLPGDSGPHIPGHDIELAVSSNQARVEDILRLGAKSSPPLMRGALTLNTKLSIPPGQVSVSKKMRLQGTFTIHGATFSNAHWQETVDKLSERAQGHPKQANPVDAQVVASQMGGSFALANQVLHVPDLNYQMPGAQVHLVGDYSLNGETFEFAGTARTDATASQMLTGWKSLVAKPFDGLLKKNGAGVEVPIKVSGTKSDPKFGVDLDKMGLGFLSKHKDQPASAKDQPASAKEQPAPASSEKP
jgi:hypothetical protein